MTTPAPQICPGCNRTFKGSRGLRTHQSGKHATMACRVAIQPIDDAPKMTPTMRKIVALAKRYGMNVDATERTGTFGFHIGYDPGYILSVYADAEVPWYAKRRGTRIRWSSALHTPAEALALLHERGRIHNASSATY